MRRVLGDRFGRFWAKLVARVVGAGGSEARSMLEIIRCSKFIILIG